MYYNNCCGYEPEAFTFTKSDKLALLREQESILGAKLATIKHWIENLEKEEAENKKK